MGVKYLGHVRLRKVSRVGSVSRKDFCDLKC